MSDIVDDLRDPNFRGAMQHLRNWSELDAMHDRAAAEITRLRSLVEEAGKVVEGIVELGEFSKRHPVQDDFDRGVRAARMDAAHAARSLLTKMKEG